MGKSKELHEIRFIGGPQDGTVRNLEGSPTVISIPVGDPIAYIHNMDGLPEVRYEEYLYVLYRVEGRVCYYRPSEYKPL